MTNAVPQLPVQNLRDAVSVVIASGESLSGPADLTGYTLVGIVMPADWTAADLTFQASHDGITFNNVYDEDDAERTVQAADDRFIALPPLDWIGLRFLKVRSGPAGAPVNQGAERTVQLVVVP